MRISLIDVDSKIPNLALMKISAYHKQKGDIVGFNISDPDVVYVSIVFSKNKWKGNGIKQMHPGVDVIIGGSGYDLKNKLPGDIEHIMPDYNLYGLDYSMGFTSRGCIRNCKFCIVPEKEGYIKPNCTIYEFWNPSHKHIVLLDNNILALPDHFKQVTNSLIENNLTVDFNQGLDIRLVTKDIAILLSQLTISPEIRFAFDDPSMEKLIRKKVKLLQKYGVGRAFFYVLVGFNTTIEEDFKRLDIIRELNQRAYVMRYESVLGKQPYTDIANWVNGRQFFLSIPFERFRKLRHIDDQYDKERDLNDYNSKLFGI